MLSSSSLRHNAFLVNERSVAVKEYHRRPQASDEADLETNSTRGMEGDKTREVTREGSETGHPGAHLQGKRALEKPSSGNGLKIAQMDLKGNGETKGDKVSGDSDALTSLVRISALYEY